MKNIKKELDFKTISTIYRGLDYYKRQLEALRKKAKQNFPEFILSDINEEIEETGEAMDFLEKYSEGKINSRFREIMDYALRMYSRGLEELKEEIEKTFKESSIELTAINKDLKNIDNCLEILE